jgi:hypothetical protein
MEGFGLTKCRHEVLGILNAGELHERIALALAILRNCIHPSHAIVEARNKENTLFRYICALAGNAVEFNSKPAFEQSKLVTESSIIAIQRIATPVA